MDTVGGHAADIGHAVYEGDMFYGFGVACDEVGEGWIYEDVFEVE